jgi:hypothetical protein
MENFQFQLNIINNNKQRSVSLLTIPKRIARKVFELKNTYKSLSFKVHLPSLILMNTWFWNRLVPENFTFFAIELHWNIIGQKECEDGCHVNDFRD